MPRTNQRLSDITLEWMVHAAVNLPDGNTPNGYGIKVDRNFLRLSPDPRGPQHDEREPGDLGGRLRWGEALRHIEHDAILHHSVYERFAADKVQHFYEMKPYRPQDLSQHDNVRKCYGASSQG